MRFGLEMLLQGFQIDKISPLEKKDKNSNEKQNILKAKNTNSFLKKVVCCWGGGV